MERDNWGDFAKSPCGLSALSNVTFWSFGADRTRSRVPPFDLLSGLGNVEADKVQEGETLPENLEAQAAGEGF